MYESYILQCKTYEKIEPMLTAVRLLTHVKRQKRHDKQHDKDQMHQQKYVVEVNIHIKKCKQKLCSVHMRIMNIIGTKIDYGHC